MIFYLPQQMEVEAKQEMQTSDDSTWVSCKIMEVRHQESIRFKHVVMYSKVQNVNRILDICISGNNFLRKK